VTVLDLIDAARRRPVRPLPVDHVPAKTGEIARP